MIPDRSIDERLSAWLLEEAPSQLPDRVLQTTFERTLSTRQRRPLLGRWSFPKLTHRWILVVLALIIVLAATLLAIGSRLPQPRLPVSGRNGLVAFDADWRVFVQNSDGTGRKQLTAGTNDFWPIWSPDGTKLAFYRTPVKDAQPWNRGVSIWVAAAGDLVATEATAGMPIDLDEVWLYSWAHDSDSLAFATGSLVSSELYVGYADGRTPRRILDGSLSPREPAWSPTGATIAFTGGPDDKDRGIYLIDVDGSRLRRLTTEGRFVTKYSYVTWSPDGTRLVYQAGDPGGEDLWTVNADGSGERRLTDTPYPISEYRPAWSPDGTTIAFQRIDHSIPSTTVNVMNADGSDRHRVSRETPIAQPLAWSPDGTRILTSACAAASEYSCNDTWDILILDPSGHDQPRRLATEPGLGVILSWQRLSP
jgi:TolB protein